MKNLVIKGKKISHTKIKKLPTSFLESIKPELRERGRFNLLEKIDLELIDRLFDPKGVDLHKERITKFWSEGDSGNG